MIDIFNNPTTTIYRLENHHHPDHNPYTSDDSRKELQTHIGDDYFATKDDALKRKKEYEENGYFLCFLYEIPYEPNPMGVVELLNKHATMARTDDTYQLKWKDDYPKKGNENP